MIESYGIEWSFYMFVLGMGLSLVAARGLPPPRVTLGTRFGPRRLLQIALLAGALRLLLYSATSMPALVLVIQVLHGPAFGLLYVSGVAFAYRYAPDGLGATAQGVVNGMNFGLGAFVGALSGGFLYEALGPFVMFRITGLILAVPALLFLRPSPRSRSA